jgi:hypothetical protein
MTAQFPGVALAGSEVLDTHSPNAQGIRSSWSYSQPPILPIILVISQCHCVPLAWPLGLHMIARKSNLNRGKSSNSYNTAANYHWPTNEACMIHCTCHRGKKPSKKLKLIILTGYVSTPGVAIPALPASRFTWRGSCHLAMSVGR